METNTVTPRKRQIVIVDDNADLAWFFAEILKLHGYETTIFADPVSALKHLLSQPPDAVICDLQMPQLDGDLLYATVERTKPELARRFLFVTAVAELPSCEPRAFSQATVADLGGTWARCVIIRRN